MVGCMCSCMLQRACVSANSRGHKLRRPRSNACLYLLLFGGTHIANEMLGYELLRKWKARRNKYLRPYSIYVGTYHGEHDNERFGAKNYKGVLNFPIFFSAKLMEKRCTNCKLMLLSQFANKVAGLRNLRLQNVIAVIVNYGDDCRTNV